MNLASKKKQLDPLDKLEAIEGVPVNISEVDFKQGDFGTYVIMRVSPIDDNESVKTIMTGAKVVVEALANAEEDKEPLPWQAVFVKHGRYWDIEDVPEQEQFPF